MEIANRNQFMHCVYDIYTKSCAIPIKYNLSMMYYENISYHDEVLYIKKIYKISITVAVCGLHLETATSVTLFIKLNLLITHNVMC